MTELSGRDFLRSAGMFGVGFAATGLQQDETGIQPMGPVTHWWGEPLGRILLNVMTVYEQPSWQAKPTGVFYYYNDVVQVLSAVGGEGLYHTNHTWLQTPDGYIYSSWVQPANSYFNPVVPIGEGGAWGVVTVPMSSARSGPSDEAYRRHWMHYNTVSRVVGLENDYYLVQEIYGYQYWVKAAHMRIIPPEEVAPISTHVPAVAKRIEISIGEQRLYALEGEAVVYSAPVSTGAPGFNTPHGEWSVIDKRHSQRMTGGVGAGAYNLPGIPWISYFTYGWVALHCCYWHNDYGRLHSNGCINLRPEDSKWLFRWTTPQANYWDFRTLATPDNPGTRIITRW
ncbi:MAG: L,D-transpeptidase [Anaerolineae bacterium]